MRLLLINTFVSIALCAASTQANEIFISFSDFGGPVAGANTVQNFNVGDTGSAFLWINPSTDISTLTVADVLMQNSMPSNPSVAVLTNGEVFNSDILDTNNTDVGDRWGETGNGTVADMGDSISGMYGFSSGFIGTTGIRMDQDGSGSNDLDSLFDPNSMAFLFARVDFVANERGTIDVTPQGILLNDGELENFDVSGAVINVVPEPTCGLAALVTMLALSVRRRNR